jgi:hypothetical protein
MAYSLVGLLSALFIGVFAEYSHDYAKQISYYAGASYCGLSNLKDWSCGPCTKASSSFTVVDAFSVEVMGAPT